MKASKLMVFFYGGMFLVPLLMFIIAITYQFHGLYEAREVLSVLSGIGIIVYGVLGYIEVFAHGKN